MNEHSVLREAGEGGKWGSECMELSLSLSYLGGICRDDDSAKPVQ